ncbi:hypothetical protein KV097_02790 [Mumia sp. zg.B17]|uniref:hypothetical protein n=2 Tax=Mumia TaxID=1546255 RepID=UPI001C6F56A5|nr:hypothetical protein [Mumia sp. zg.B17]MBW9204857.1 hypothetical protein [Mumia sp. zg.B17]
MTRGEATLAGRSRDRVGRATIKSGGNMKKAQRQARTAILVMVAATALAVGAPAYAGAVQSPPATAQGTSTPSADDAVRKAPRTVITLKIAGCEGCRLRPTQAVRGKSAWTGKAKRVRDGKVRWSVRTDRTAGLTFFVERNPKAASTTVLNAVPMIVARYRGKAVGSRVSDAAARKAKRATPCLRGTQASRFTRRVVVRYSRVDDPTGPGTVRVPRYYFKKTQRATKPYSRTFKGTLAAQDLYVCP